MCLLFLSVQVLGQTATLNASANALNFLVLGDWGGKGGTTQVTVAQQMGRTAEILKSRFVITRGDNYHGNGIDSADSPRWQREYERVYANPALMIPWYPSIGNHDTRGSAAAEIEYSKMSLRWRMPSRYYAHTEKFGGTNEVLFVHLDTSPFVAAYRKRALSITSRTKTPTNN